MPHIDEDGKLHTWSTYEEIKKRWSSKLAYRAPEQSTQEERDIVDLLAMVANGANREKEHLDLAERYNARLQRDHMKIVPATEVALRFAEWASLANKYPSGELINALGALCEVLEIEIDFGEEEDANAQRDP